jgi:hypothetical protein
MKYPQLFVLVSEKSSLPSLECLQAWSDSNHPVYVHGLSEPISAVNTRINQIRKVHGYLHHEFSSNISAALVFPIQKIPTLLHLWLSSVDHEVYWLESAKVAARLQKNLNKCLRVSSCLQMNTHALSLTYDMAKSLFDSIFETEHSDPTPAKKAITEYGVSLDCRVLDFFLETTRPGAIQCS